MNYKELKEKHQKVMNEFPIFFAFSDEQFAKGMEKFGLSINDTDKLLSIGYGGYIKKSDRDAFRKMGADAREEIKEAMKDYAFALSAFKYELSNNEFCITGDPTDTLDSLNLTMEEVEKDAVLNKAFLTAVGEDNL